MLKERTRQVNYCSLGGAWQLGSSADKAFAVTFFCCTVVSLCMHVCMGRGWLVKDLPCGANIKNHVVTLLSFYSNFNPAVLTTCVSTRFCVWVFVVVISVISFPLGCFDAGLKGFLCQHFAEIHCDSASMILWRSECALCGLSKCWKEGIKIPSLTKQIYRSIMKQWGKKFE